MVFSQTEKAECFNRVLILSLLNVAPGTSVDSLRLSFPRAKCGPWDSVNALCLAEGVL